jgi:hypothetical protein
MRTRPHGGHPRPHKVRAKVAAFARCRACITRQQLALGGAAVSDCGCRRWQGQQ